MATPSTGSGSQLRQVGADRVVDAEPSKTDQIALDTILLALKALSQRTLVALSQLFTLLTCASAFALWYSVLPNPNSYQLVGLALYGGFILLLHLVKRKEKS
jgi:hypothetical protein